MMRSAGAVVDSICMPFRWEDIRRLWLQHGIPTLIARKLESTVDNGGWETL